MLHTHVLYAKADPNRIRAKISAIESEMVNPLLKSMMENSFSFISDRLQHPNSQISATIASQRAMCNEIVSQVSVFAKVDVPKDAQDKIFSFCGKLLPPTIKFGYTDEATDLLRILLHPNLVGDHCKWDPERVFKMISATYGKRKALGDTDRMKYNNRAFIDEIIAGKYGKQDKSSAEIIETLKFCYKNPDKILSGDDGHHSL